MAPKISIIIPCYNHGNFIREAIASVEKCPRDLWELIIVNDGSTDKDTIRILQDLKDEGYRVIDQENNGLGAARNTGISEASGEFVLPLDSDNKIRPIYLEKAIEILDAQPDVGVVYGDAEYFGERNGPWIGRKFNLGRLLAGNFIDACAVVRRSVWTDVGGYDTGMPRQGMEDWDFWLSAAERNWKFYYIPQTLFDYRVRKDSMINELERESGFYETIDYVVLKHLSLLRSEFQAVSSTLEWHSHEIQKDLLDR